MGDEIGLYTSGKMAWEMVEQECLFLPTINPYKRFVLLFCLGLIAGGAACHSLARELVGGHLDDGIV